MNTSYTCYNIPPIMTLFREFEVKYRQAGDMSFAEEIASGLLDECRDLEKRIKALPATSMQDFAAKLIVETRYGNFTLDEAGEGGLYDQALSILAQPGHPVAALIDAFAGAKAAYDIVAEGDTPEWDAYEAAELAVIVHPCQSMDEVREKARFFLDEAGPNDTLRNCRSGDNTALDLFLRSLIGEAQP
jgi:hypothetical protein